MLEMAVRASAEQRFETRNFPLVGQIVENPPLHAVDCQDEERRAVYRSRLRVVVTLAQLAHVPDLRELRDLVARAAARERECAESERHRRSSETHRGSKHASTS